MTPLALLLALASPWASPSNPPPVTTAEQACAVLKTRFIAQDPRLRSVIAFCDAIPEVDGPPDYFVMALHSNRRCDGVCSSNMGWFAVRKSTGEVFDWDVAEWKTGKPLDSTP